MIFDLIVRECFTPEGKQVLFTCRAHDTTINHVIRKFQDNGKYIHSIIPLFRSAEEDEFDNKTVVKIVHGIQTPIMIVEDEDKEEQRGNVR